MDQLHTLWHLAVGALVVGYLLDILICLVFVVVPYMREMKKVHPNAYQALIVLPFVPSFRSLFVHLGRNDFQRFTTETLRRRGSLLKKAVFYPTLAMFVLLLAGLFVGWLML